MMSDLCPVTRDPKPYPILGPLATGQLRFAQPADQTFSHSLVRNNNYLRQKLFYL